MRLQGNAWNNRLDWLVGGYYANEKLAVDDNLAYGADYSRFGNCLVAANFVAGGAPASLLAPGASPTCINPAVAQGLRDAPLAAGGLIASLNAAAAAGQLTTAANLASTITALGAFARLNNPALTAGPVVLTPAINFGAAPFGNSGFTNVAIALGGPSLAAATLNGAALNDAYRQNSNNWALFTHNIFSITDRLKLTLGARYTHEKKTLDATLLDNNVLCTVFSGSSLQQLPCVIPSAAGGAFGIDNSRSESKVSGTAVISYKPTDRLLTYASYSRGYKAGGFNLDRSALWRAQPIPTTVPATPGTAVLGNPPLSGSGAICTSTAQKGCQGIVASGADLQFKPEINDAFEAGLKYHGRGIDVNFAVFHQVFRDFQLNTFNGLNFFVETLNSCSTDLNGADVDNDPRSGACTGHTRAGVRSQGFELEAFTRPMTDLAINGGLTMSDTKYRNNLIGSDGRAVEQCAVPASRTADLECADVDRDWIGRLDPADRRLGASRSRVFRRPLHEQVQHRLGPRHREDAEQLRDIQRPRRDPRAGRCLGDRGLGPESVRQELSASRVRCAGAGFGDDSRGDLRVHPAFDPAVRRVPRRAAHVRRNPAREDGLQSPSTARVHAAACTAAAGGRTGSAACTAAAAAGSRTRARLTLQAQM